MPFSPKMREKMAAGMNADARMDMTDHVGRKSKGAKGRMKGRKAGRGRKVTRKGRK